MKQNLKITIATVVYNGAATLRDTIQSVASQTYADIEYLIVDGSSTDDTLRIAQEFAERYSWMKIQSEPDQGIYDAMNKAGQMATRDFLLFLGCDDLLYNTTVVGEFVTSIQDVNAVYYGDVIASDSRDIRYGHFTTEKLSLQNISHQAIFYPQCVYSKYKYNLKYKLFSDWEYNIRVWAQEGAFVRLNMTITVYGENGASSRPDEVFFADRRRIVQRYFGNRYGWLVSMQQAKKKMLKGADFRKIKGYIFPKIK